MAFKLGSSKGLQAKGGNISKKLSFKSGGEHQVFKKKLGEGIMGEANNDGSIFIDPSVPANMVGYVANHEYQHQTDMKSGRTTYTDDYVMHDGEMWIRDNGSITDPNSGKKYMEGSKELPWEANKI